MCSGGGSGTGSIASEYMGIAEQALLQSVEGKEKQGAPRPFSTSDGADGSCLHSNMLYYHSTLHNEETEVERTSCLMLQSKKGARMPFHPRTSFLSAVPRA